MNAPTPLTIAADTSLGVVFVKAVATRKGAVLIEERLKEIVAQAERIPVAEVYEIVRVTRDEAAVVKPEESK